MWFSDTQTLHSRHVAECGPVSVTVAPSSPSMMHIEVVQMRGQASSADDLQSDLAAVYFRRFPMARAMSLASQSHRFYLLEPTWARLVRLVAGVSRNQEWSVAG